MEEILSFGYRLRRRRKALDLTQADLGRLVGASAAMIRKIEADERRPSRELAELLAEHLDVPASEREAFLRSARHVAITDAPVIPQTSPAPPDSNLPAPMTSMVNRVRDLAHVTALLLREDVRLLTLIGPPGMGKTRLSIQAAERVLSHFADGVWFVDLSPITDPNLLLPTIATTLGLVPAPGLSPVEQVHKALREKQLLLVLDNLEQVVDRAAEDVAGLLRACRDVKVLATSRVRLDVYGEHEYALPPMSIPPEGASSTPDELFEYEAVQLFIARTQQHQPDFGLSAETAEPVAEICRRMDGLPLALELAAARTRRMPVTELAAVLRQASGRDWHALLHTSARDLPPRQRTLFNAIAWSYSLLESDLQAMLGQLSVFTGSFDWMAVVAVTDVPNLADETARRRALDLLVDHNLVSRTSPSLEQWRLLEMVIEFARSQLDDSEREAALARHARHYAARLMALYERANSNAYLIEIDALVNNGRRALATALSTAEITLAHQLSAALEPYWEGRGLYSEGRRQLATVLAMPGPVDDSLRYDNIVGASNLAWMQHDLAAALDYASSALTLAQRQGDMGQVADVLNILARIRLEEGLYEKADALLVEGIHVEASLPAQPKTHFMMIQRGEVALALADLERAGRLTREGLEGVTARDLIPYCVGWNNLAEIALARGDTAAARNALQLVLPLAPLHTRRMRVFLVAVAGLLLAKPHSAERDVQSAAQLLSYIRATNDRLGDPLSPMIQRFLAARLEETRTRLTPDMWQRARAEGQRWTAEQALSLAGQVLDDTLRPFESAGRALM